MNKHYGRLVTMMYRSRGPMLQQDVLRVEFRAPDGELYHHDLLNDQWMIHNGALQFLATQGYRPSDLDGTRYDAEDDKVHFVLAPRGDSYALSMDAVREECLEAAEWFDGDDDSDGDPPNQNPGGGGPDPGTGNRGGVDHEDDGGVEMELAEEDSNSGVEITIS